MDAMEKAQELERHGAAACRADALRKRAAQWLATARRAIGS